MLSVLFAVSLQGTLTFPAGTYTPSQLAASLSQQGVPTRVGPGLEDRVYALRWTKRPVSEFMPALRTAVGVLLSREADGSYVLQTDPTRDAEDDAVFGTYAAAFDKRFQDAMRQVNAWGVFNPDGQGLVRAALALKIPLSRDDAGTPQLGGSTEETLAKSSQAVRDAFAFALIFEQWRTSTESPGVTFLQLQKGIRTMIPSDQWVTGDLNFWTRANYPAWMNVRTSTLIQNETAAVLGQRRGRPNREQVDVLQRRLGGFYVTHRSSFDMRVGRIRIDSIAANPTFAQEYGERFDLGIFQDTPTPARLAALLPPDRNPQAQAIETRLAATARTVASMGGTWQVTPGEATLSAPMLDWASRNEKDFVMEVSSLRDHNMAGRTRSTPRQGGLASLNVWAQPSEVAKVPTGRIRLASVVPIVEDDDSIPTTASYSAADLNGVLAIRNEAAGFDRKVPGGMADLVRYRALCTKPLPTVIAQSPQVATTSAGWWVQNESLAPGDMVALLPVFQYLATLSPTVREGLFSALKAGEEHTVALSAPTGALADRLVKFVKASPYVASANEGVILHPGFPAWLKRGRIVFTVVAGKCQVRLDAGGVIDTPAPNDQFATVLEAEFPLILE